jgi:hypothetical protein
MAINPYTGKATAGDKIAFVDPKTGNMSVVGGGASLTDHQRSVYDDFIAKGYARVDDPNIIKQLQANVGNLQPNAGTSDWASAFAKTGASVTGPSQADIQAAQQRLDQYKLSQQASKPVGDRFISTATGAYFKENSPEHMAYLAQQDQLSQQRREERDFNSPQAQQTPQTPQTPQVTQQSVADLEKQKRINELERAYQQSLGKLQTEEEKGIKLLEEGRSQTRTQGMMNAKAFEDYLAQKGIASSGTAPQGFLQQQGQLQGALGASQRQQQQFQTDIGRQRAELGSQLEFGKSQSELDAQLMQAQEAQRMQALQEQRAYEERLMQMGWTRQDAQTESQRAYDEQVRQQGWNRQDTLFDKDIAREDALNIGRLTPQQQQEVGNLGQYQNDFQAEINRRQATPDTSDDWLIPYLAAARQQKIQSQGLDQQGRPIPQASVEAPIPTVTSSTAMDLWKALGVANETVARVLGVPVGTRYQAPKSTSTSGTTKTPTQPLW